MTLEPTATEATAVYAGLVRAVRGCGHYTSTLTGTDPTTGKTSTFKVAYAAGTAPAPHVTGSDQATRLTVTSGTVTEVNTLLVRRGRHLLLATVSGMRPDHTSAGCTGTTICYRDISQNQLAALEQRLANYATRIWAAGG